MKQLPAGDLAMMVCDWCMERYKICEFILYDKTMSKSRKDKAAGALEVLEELDEKMRNFLSTQKTDDSSS